MEVTVFITVDQWSDTMPFCMVSQKTYLFEVDILCPWSRKDVRDLDFRGSRDVRSPKGHETGICL